MNSVGRIFKIQRFCLHDGPGIRTVIFFKGCPLRCLWCSNPESQNFEKEILYNQSLCINCRKCTAVCPQRAITAISDTITVNRDICIHCSKCQNVCPSAALMLAGRELSVEEVSEIVLADASYYYTSNGGVTFSGGEPLSQDSFIIQLAKKLTSESIHIAIETSGFASSQVFSKVISFMDEVLFDIKFVNQKEHIRLIGVPNDTILANLGIAAQEKPTTVRIPLIPGINTNYKECEDIAKIISNYPVYKVELIPYHPYGLGKYQQLGKTGWKPDNFENFNYLGILNIFSEVLNIPVRLHT